MTDAPPLPHNKPAVAPKAEPHRSSAQQRITGVVIDLVMVSLGFWVLSGFFGALAWAVVLTIATWPLYDRFSSLFKSERRRDLAPALFTILIALVFIVPFGVAVVEIWREAKSVLKLFGEAERAGFPVPDFLWHLPFFSQQITNWWQTNLTDPGSISELLGRADTGKFAAVTQQVGAIIARRLTYFSFTILTLFFLFREGLALGRRFRTLCNRLMGAPGEHLANLAVSAVRSTADGLVLVGLGEGALLGVAYFVFGAPHPALLGAFTGLLAMVPFGAPVVFSLASALLLIEGEIGRAVGVFVAGWVVVAIADHGIRPVLIGGSTKLPFLLVLLGIFGGLETFGLVGLFLGPAIMAALVSLWREWTDPVPRRLTVKSGS
jgi:predicted PurR-regulated permease PerM